VCDESKTPRMELLDDMLSEELDDDGESLFGYAIDDDFPDPWAEEEEEQLVRDEL
jgi:hypothetical protein